MHKVKSCRCRKNKGGEIQMDFHPLCFMRNRLRIKMIKGEERCYEERY